MRKLKDLVLGLALMLAGLSTIVSCSDDDGIWSEVKFPDDVNLMELDRWSYEIPFNIESDSEWKIEIDGDICYASPENGTGSCQVKICVIDNISEESRDGEMQIVFPKDRSKNQTIKIHQKGEADYDDNAVSLEVGNRIYAVGYGYDPLGEYASPKSVKSVLIRYADAAEEEKIVLGPLSVNYNAKTYSGSSVADLRNELNADAKFGGSYMGFKGEIGASFNMKDFSKNSNEYAISYINVSMCQAYIDVSIDEIAREWLTPNAYQAVNGLDKNGKPSKIYPSTVAGFKKLFKAYGTHFIKSATLGGRMKYTTVVDISQVEGSYDLNAYANAGYKNSFVHASVEVSDNLKQSYANNSKAITTNLTIRGGDKQAAMALAGGDSDENLKNWRNSLSIEQGSFNCTLVDLDYKEDLVPLYELVDLSLPGGEDRQKKMKDYMEGKQIELDLTVGDMVYETGVSAHIKDIPSFNESDKTASLIKDIYIGGQAVARLCEEYIPVINKNKRCKVIYPLISNKPKYNMGLFIGDETHRPAKVSWQGENVYITELVNEPIGARKELYVRGSSFNTTGNGVDIYEDADAKDYKWNAPGYNGSHYYSLVKIFDKIWMRENYQANRKEDGDRYGEHYDLEPVWASWNGSEQCYYSEEMVTATSGIYHFAPTGWRTPLADDYLKINLVLKNNDVPISTAKAFYPDKEGGVLGFHHIYVGRRSLDRPGVGINVDRTYYVIVSQDGKFDGQIVFEKDDESFGQHYWTWGESCYPARLVQTIK